jgi:hypothetical protein
VLRTNFEEHPHPKGVADDHEAQVRKNELVLEKLKVMKIKKTKDKPLFENTKFATCEVVFSEANCNTMPMIVTKSPRIKE